MLFPVVPRDRTGDNEHKLEHKKEVPLKHQATILCYAGARAQAQATQRGCGASLLGDLQKPLGCGPGKPALGGHKYRMLI